jgi:putative ABC transport system permease protein
MDKSSLRHTVRALAKSPGFTAIAILTLALGIGANTAVFTLVSGILIHPLPYPESEGLVGMWHTAPGVGFPQIEQTDATFMNYRDSARSFEDMALYRTGSRTFTDGGEPEQIEAAFVTASLFTSLRVQALAGRAFSADEDVPGAEPVAVVSHSLFARRFGSDRSLVGKIIRLDGIDTRVVGVMPKELSFPDASTDLWLPLQLDRTRYRDTSFSYFAVGRLRPGVSIEEAETEMGPILKRITETYPGDLTQSMLEQAKMAPVLHPLKQDVVGEVETPLWILLGTVGFVLLVAAANVANLFLVRADGRHREVAVRTALGASRFDIARLYLSESLLLGFAGGVFGLGFAFAAVSLFVDYGAMELPRLEEVGIDASVLLFTLAMSLLAGFLFGLVPILRLESTRLAAGLNEIGRGLTAGRERLSVRAMLVVTQVAFALVLLIGSGLMARSYWRLRSVEPGFDPASTLTFEMSLPKSQYPGEQEAGRFVRELTERVGRLSGVATAAVTTRLPLSGSYDNNAIQVEEFPVPEGQIPPVHPTRFVSPDYFVALSIPLLEGRTFEWNDRDRGLRTAIVSRAFADKYWPGRSPLGKRLGTFMDSGLYEIIGVAANVRDESLDKEPVQTIYFPINQSGPVQGSFQVLVRTRTEPRALFDSIREEIRGLDRNLPLSGVRTMEERVTRSTARTTFTMILLALSAVVAVLLGCIGIYGVVSYLVSQRRNEIGIRIALGAGAREVERMFVVNGLRTALAGTVLGLFGSLALTRLLSSLLFEVRPFDPLTYAAAATAILGVAVAASALPARRASRVDPVIALRGE